jgi:C-terminal processing protease CtpA/Prc
LELLSERYAFTEYKGIDWDALQEEFRPRFEEAEGENDSQLYLTALRDFAWSIPDGHVSGPLLVDEFRQQTSGGLGIAIRELDDGRVIVNFLLEGSPAHQAGMELGTEIVSINDTPIQEVISDSVAYSAPFSTDHFRRLQQMRYATRFPLDTEVDVTFVNPDSNQQTVTLTAVPEQASFSFSSFNVGRTGFELPLEYELLEDSGLGYVKVYSFSDNDLLTIQLWERMIRTLRENDVPGLIIDLRQNGGGRGFLADQMAAYFFDEELELGNTGFYDEDRGEFYFDPDREQQYYLPEEEFRYDGDLAVVIGPNCNSACEFFAYDLTLQDRSTVVGHYPTAGLGGSVDRVLMPENEFFQFTQGRAVDPEGEIHIEGKGVPPDIEVPVNEETLLSEGDPLLDAAVAHLSGSADFEVVDGGTIELGDEVTGELESDQRVRYAVILSGGDIIDISLESDDVDTILGLYDEDGNLLGTTEGAESTVEGLEIPFDLVLILEVSSADDAGQGEYTLRVTESEE